MYATPRVGRTSLALGGTSFRKQSYSDEMRSKIDRARVAARPAASPIFARGSLSSRESIIERLRKLYGKDKKVYTLRSSNADHTGYRF